MGIQGSCTHSGNRTGHRREGERGREEETDGEWKRDREAEADGEVG